jgi:sec-independent protein translocase protein TatB
MFDLGISELMVVFVIALVVLGPTRLPGLVSKVGHWMGKARGMARQFREQLENEVNLDELNRMTDRRAKEAREQGAQTPPPPPEFTGAPIETPLDAGSGDSTTGQTTEFARESSQPQDAPQASDDSYSHAHAANEAPMPYTPEAAEFTAATPEVVLDEQPAPERPV